MDIRPGDSPVRFAGVPEGAIGCLSEAYRRSQNEFHILRPDYGTGGHQWAPIVMRLCTDANTTDVLDYGCGKATLNLQLPFGVKCFDPCIPKYAAPPEPADIVVCTDVMEHVEEEQVPGVLDHLKQLTKRVLFLNVALCEAKKILPDGRNAHITIKPARWWTDQIETRFNALSSHIDTDAITLVLSPKS